MVKIKVLIGDLHGLNTYKHQPIKVAAIEGRWETEKGVPLTLFAIPDQEQEKNHYAIEIPKLGSLILRHDINGEVIGINTAVAGGDAENVGFSIPLNDIQGLVKSVLAKGVLERPYLGIRYITLNDQYAEELDLTVKRGAYISASEDGVASIISGSPADKAGLKEKDIIIKVDGVAIDERNSLISLVGRKSVGDKVSLTVIRDGMEQSISVTLESLK